jgi:hypothetical protein
LEEFAKSRLVEADLIGLSEQIFENKFIKNSFIVTTQKPYKTLQKNFRKLPFRTPKTFHGKNLYYTP